MGRIAPGLFIKHKGSGKQKKEAPKEEGEKKGAVEQVTSLKKMAIDVQKILDFIAGLLEKGFHTFVWIRPQATFTLCVALGLSSCVLYHVSIRYLLLLWGTKKLAIYGIKPDYQDNNELLDFLSRIPTIPELKRYQAEIVIKEEPEEEDHVESDADVEEEQKCTLRAVYFKTKIEPRLLYKKSIF